MGRAQRANALRRAQNRERSREVRGLLATIQTFDARTVHATALNSALTDLVDRMDALVGWNEPPRARAPRIDGGGDHDDLPALPLILDARREDHAVLRLVPLHRLRLSTHRTPVRDARRPVLQQTDSATYRNGQVIWPLDFVACIRYALGLQCRSHG